MKYLAILFALLLAACSPVLDSPQLRSAIATKYPPQETGALGGTLRITLLTPPPVTIAPAVLPTVTPSPECLQVKGNISRDGRKLYHTPDSPQYAQVVIDEAAGERIFCQEQDAIDAGWTKAGTP